ncbi:hypothetical protein APS_2243 [Acetobacter pasteurianus subsp. pasteurianus LMG 1262 = NBRC 106471]|nr:hypothetical protein APS_2243 [Acetobacter pasteurianus subsp. pasteurianus LMG 1262 = NBRC 106471]CCT59434.1 hypothetical protein APA386B_1345 [Acetobacter pasteurianus 386B]
MQLCAFLNCAKREVICEKNFVFAANTRQMLSFWPPVFLDRYFQD